MSTEIVDTLRPGLSGRPTTTCLGTGEELEGPFIIPIVTDQALIIFTTKLYYLIRGKQAHQGLGDGKEAAWVAPGLEMHLKELLVRGVRVRGTNRHDGNNAHGPGGVVGGRHCSWVPQEM